MTTMRDADDAADLREAFAGLRREDSTNAPAFEAVLAAAQAGSNATADRRRPARVPVMVGMLVAAALVSALITTVAVRRPESRLPSMASIEQWTPPTDFLLETPGREVLETVPRIGTPPTFAPLDGAAESGPRAKRRRVSP